MNLWWTYQQLRSSNLKTRLAVIAKLASFAYQRFYAAGAKDKETKNETAQ